MPSEPHTYRHTTAGKYYSYNKYLRMPRGYARTYRRKHRFTTNRVRRLAAMRRRRGPRTRLRVPRGIGARTPGGGLRGTVSGRPGRREFFSNSTRRINTTNSKSTLNRLLGPPPGQGTLRKNHKISDWTTFPQHKLNTVPLIAIEYSSTPTDLNKRNDGAVLLKGVSLTARFKTFNLENLAPIRVRWAIIANKETLANTNTAIPDADFFHPLTKTSILESGFNFTTTDSAVTMERRRINTRKYLVVREGRFHLQKNGNNDNELTGGGTTQLDRFATIQQYIPLNTQIRFDNNATGPNDDYPADNNLFFVWWAYRINKVSTQIDNTTALAEIMQDISVYWRNSNIN